MSAEDILKSRNWQGGRSLPAIPTINPVMIEKNAHLTNIEHMMRDRLYPETLMADWRDVSNVLDRLYFIIYLLITFGVTLTFLIH